MGNDQPVLLVLETDAPGVKSSSSARELPSGKIYKRWFSLDCMELISVSISKTRQWSSEKRLYSFFLNLSSQLIL